jgi:hypothetical protein
MIVNKHIEMESVLTERQREREMDGQVSKVCIYVYITCAESIKRLARSILKVWMFICPTHIFSLLFLFSISYLSPLTSHLTHSLSILRIKEMKTVTYFEVVDLINWNVRRKNIAKHENPNFVGFEETVCDAVQTKHFHNEGGGTVTQILRPQIKESENQRYVDTHK